MKKVILLVLSMSICIMVGCANKKSSLSTESGNVNPASNNGSAALSNEKQISGTTPAEASKQETSEKASLATAAFTDTGAVFEIKEKMFIEQCNDIYLNPNDYKNVTIKLEGMYDTYTDPETGIASHFVIRNAPGCCGFDGQAGFEFYYDGDLPETNDWIEAIGQVKIEKEDGYDNVVLKLSRLTVMDVRGLEYVS